MVDVAPSTPLSTTTTLSGTSSPVLKPASFLEDSLFSNPRTSASNLVEIISSAPALSSAVYIYDLAHQAGFGTLTKLRLSTNPEDVAPVVHLQTRSGAGLALVGRLSEGTSKDTSKASVITAYTTPAGLSLMANSLTYLPAPTPTSRLILQVPTVTPVGESLTFSPSLYSLSTTISLLPNNIVVLLSATPQESVDFAGLAYALTGNHVIHLFDHFSSAREQGHAIEPVKVESTASASSADVIKRAGYSFFEYAGDAEATNVVVLLNSPLALAVKSLVAGLKGVGVVLVKVLRPWDEAALRQVLPSSVTKVHVFDDVQNVSTQGPLYVDVLGALMEQAGRPPRVQGHRITPSQTQEFLEVAESLSTFLQKIAPSSAAKPTFEATPSKKLLFIASPKSPLASVPQVIESTLLAHGGLSARLLTDHDFVTEQAGISASRIVLAAADAKNRFVPIPFLAPLAQTSAESFDFIGVLDAELLHSHSILKHASQNASLLIASPWTLEEFSANAPRQVLRAITEKRLRVYLIDVENIATQLTGRSGEETHLMRSLVAHLAFFRLHAGKDASEAAVQKLAKVVFDENVLGVPLAKAVALAWHGLTAVELPPMEFDVDEKVHPLKNFEFNTIATEVESQDGEETDVGEDSWHLAAKHILFPGIFNPTETELAPVAKPEVVEQEISQDPLLHPELPERTFLVTCTVNRRLTPAEYERNLFHLEFDTAGTGLKYKLGEALGVHGWNDDEEVFDFCKWYGVDPNHLVTLPVPGSEGSITHTRTVLQVLQQQLDIFGKPPKSFFSALAPYATRQYDRMALLFIGSNEGAATLRKLNDKDTVTYADVLKKYDSARPPIEALCEMVLEIKPRHYSIASSQSVVGDRVDLLIVTVEWNNPEGKARFGQCTRYLNNMKVGQKMTVSIKPSVMKLPEDPMQPIIMAGLGTGAAPFRAFLQHRAMMRMQGETNVGPMYYYFGSRSQAAEYLYGEEIEAFLLEGTLTKAGLAFSRDQPEKIYVQHKMLEDAQLLGDMLKEQQNGVFYLCGPTWPVPEIFEALVGSLTSHHGMTREGAEGYIEKLKEDERYVLEVY